MYSEKNLVENQEFTIQIITKKIKIITQNNKEHNKRTTLRLKKTEKNRNILMKTKLMEKILCMQWILKLMVIF